MASSPRAGRGMPEDPEPLGAGHHLKNKRRPRPPFSSAFEPTDRTDSQTFFTYAEHQPFPATCLPGKIGQPPHASVGLP